MEKLIKLPNDAVIYEIDLDLYKKTDNDTVKAIQYDKNKRYIVATIWNNGIQYPLTENHSVEFRTTKLSGFGVDNTCEIDEQGRIVYQITEQTTVESGLFKAEFKISDADGNIRPFLFNIFVEKSALQNDTVVSAPEINILDNLIQDATNVINNMNELSEEVLEAIKDTDEAINNTNDSANYANEQGNYAKDMGDFALQKSQQVDSVLNDVNDTITSVNQIADTLNQLNQDIIIVESEREAKESLREIQEEDRQNFYESSNKLETYSDTVEYVINNKVTYQGGTYQCIMNSIGVTPSFNSDNAYWKCIAAKGDKGIGERGIQGIQGKSYISKGNWDSNISYTNDATTTTTVLYAGSTYSCVQSHISSASNRPPNTTYWQLLAQKGADGLGAGDMLQSVYDPQGRHIDIFEYIDDKTFESDLPDNLLYYSTDTSEVDTPAKRDSDLLDGKPREYYEDLVHDIENKLENKLNNDGDSKDNIVTFDNIESEENLSSGLTHSKLWGIAKKNFSIIDIELKNAKDRADEAFQSASNGKEEIKNAITGVDPSIIIPTDATFAQLANAIGEIETGINTDDATATAEQILAGMTAYIKGIKVSGTMLNRGAVNQTLSINGTYTIPSGYHNGSGKVSQTIPTKGAQTFMPSTVDQTIAANQYLTGIQTIKGDGNLVPANILSGKSIFGVAGNLIQGKKFATGITAKSSTSINFTAAFSNAQAWMGMTAYSQTISTPGITPEIVYLWDSEVGICRGIAIFNGVTIGTEQICYIYPPILSGNNPAYIYFKYAQSLVRYNGGCVLPMFYPALTYNYLVFGS